MIVRIGTMFMFMGKVDAVGPHSIETKFFGIGVPLIPLGSTFFTARHASVNDRAWKGALEPLWKKVAA